ncbi:hypothetical protein PPERSA_05513 [Pseudocohnilembus persalinus]|uniref:Uncharacterized protein n=1 Tax=Pseudocohnilembus persalinus TaxID=266149 RepID=A0A0V0QCX2_PSEPJ|nr:hypothetical protein PPERSA_05513 [Pseudocohnilembus persalinus]|eukprot:KRX00011.1 hypothetical protein PPERSA_05513 [Pseudocohnilembus persalinus]
MKLTLVIYICVALLCVNAAQMPLFISGQNDVQVQTQEELINALSLKDKLVFLDIETPFNTDRVLSILRNGQNKMPSFMEKFGSQSFQSFLEYNSQQVINEVSSKLNKEVNEVSAQNDLSSLFESQENIKVVKCPLNLLKKIEELFKQEATFVMMFNQQQSHRKLQEADQEDGDNVNYISQMQSEGLLGLIVGFITFLVILTGTQCLMGIQVPLSFVPKHMVVGKES